MKKESLLLGGTVLGLMAGKKKKQKGSQARLTTMSARMTYGKEAGTYAEASFLLLAIREAVQNSLDAVRSAINTGQISEEEAFVSVTLDDVNNRLIIEDSGIGMDRERLKAFITLHGSDKGDEEETADASGGWGVAKAVIFRLSENFKASVRTQSYFMPIDGFEDPDPNEIDDGIVSGLARIQGTILVIEDISNYYFPSNISGKLSNQGDATSYSSHLFGRSWVSGLSDPIENLLGCVGTTIPIFYTYRIGEIQLDYDRDDLIEVTKNESPRFRKDPVHRLFNIDDGGLYQTEKAIRIDGVSGRKSKRKSGEPIDLPNKKRGDFLNISFYLCNKNDSKSSDLKHRLSMWSMHTCVRLNGMFMFFVSNSVSSDKLKSKVLLMDINTNIRPYEGGEYPVDKTRENLSGKSKDALSSLIQSLASESLSAGEDYEGRVIASSSTSGIMSFQKKITEKYLSRFLKIGMTEKNISSIEGTVNAVLKVSRPGDIQLSDEERRKSDFSFGTSWDGEDVELLVAPIHYSSNEFEARFTPDVFLDLIREVSGFSSSIDEGSSMSYYMREMVHTFNVMRVSNRWQPNTAFHRKENGNSIVEGLGFESGSYYHQAPFHLIFLDIRDAVYFYLLTHDASYDADRLHTSHTLIAKLNLVICALWNWESLVSSTFNYEDYAFDTVFTSEQKVASLYNLLLVKMHGKVFNQRPDRDDDNYYFAMKEPAFWYPKLKVTREFFGERQPDIVSKLKKPQKLLRAIKKANCFSDLKLNDEFDLFGYPNTDLKAYNVGRNSFEMCTSYLGTQLICILQSTYNHRGDRVFPIRIKERDSKNPIFIFKFVVIYFERMKTELISSFVFAYTSNDKVAIKSAGKKLKDFNTQYRNFYKEIPKKIKKYEGLPEELTINPFDGFGSVRYSTELKQTEINKINRDFMKYVPILICWSTVLSFIQAIYVKNGIKPKNVYSGLAFGDQKFLALAVGAGDEDSGMLFLNPDKMMVNAKSDVDEWGSKMYSVALHEYCHIGEMNHQQGYANQRDMALMLTLPYLPYILNMIASIMDMKPSSSTKRQMQLQAKLAVKQQEIKQLRKSK